MFYLICREYLFLRGDLSRDKDWEVMVDLFMYRDFDAKKEKALEDEDQAEEEEEGEKEGDVVKESLKKYGGEGGEEGEEGEEDGEDEEADSAWK